MERITSRDNAKIKYACRLAASGAFRRSEGRFFAEGRKLCPELAKGAALETLFLTDGCFLAYHFVHLTNLPLLTSFTTENSCFAGVQTLQLNSEALRTVSLGPGSFRFTKQLEIKAAMLTSFVVGRLCFHEAEAARWNDLSHLQNIEIGYKAFEKSRLAEIRSDFRIDGLNCRL